LKRPFRKNDSPLTILLCVDSQKAAPLPGWPSAAIPTWLCPSRSLASSRAEVRSLPNPLATDAAASTADAGEHKRGGTRPARRFSRFSGGNLAKVCAWPDAAGLSRCAFRAGVCRAILALVHVRGRRSETVRRMAGFRIRLRSSLLRQSSIDRKKCAAGRSGQVGPVAVRNQRIPGSTGTDIEPLKTSAALLEPQNGAAAKYSHGQRLSLGV
jgi:hypothetical protein